MHKKHPITSLYLMQGSLKYETSVSFNNFVDGDTHCLIEDTNHISGAKVLIFHYLYPNQNEQIMRLLFLINTLRDLQAKEISIFTPYLPYARQDKAHLPGESVSSAILCRLIHDSGCDSLYTVDCHFLKGKLSLTVGGLKIHNILIQNTLIQKLKKQIGEEFHVVGPDDGSTYLANGRTMKKMRSAEYSTASDGSIRRAIETLDDKHLDINAKTLVVADDMISTGSTMIKALEALLARGIQELYVMASHGLFLNDSYERIRMLTRGIVYSDTITQEGSVPVVADVFKEVLRNM